MNRLLPIIAFALLCAPLASAQETIYRRGDGVTLPVVVKEVKPDYTREAMQAGIQGDVILKVVVTSAGDVGNVQVARSLDKEFGLDDAAVDAAKQWKFKPGTRQGKPVAVEVDIELTFRLK